MCTRRLKVLLHYASFRKYYLLFFVTMESLNSKITEKRELLCIEPCNHEKKFSFTILLDKIERSSNT